MGGRQRLRFSSEYGRGLAGGIIGLTFTEYHFNQFTNPLVLRHRYCLVLPPLSQPILPSRL
jgi:hypothetical protein